MTTILIQPSRDGITVDRDAKITFPPKFRAGQFVKKQRGKTITQNVMIYELCPVPTTDGSWRYWYSYTAPSGQMHLAVADEGEFMT